MSAGPSEKPAKYSLLPPGKLIGSRYAIERVIGEGTTGVVYLARRVVGAEALLRGHSAERVALKVIHRHLCGTEQIFKRFHREAKILSRLEGEHIVRLYDFIEDDGLLAIALEHVEGLSLEDLLAESAPLSARQAIEITLQVCAALGAAHAGGIVHRDLKPANVLLAHAEGASLAPADLRVKVVDFGLGKVMQGEGGSTGMSLTEQGMIFGTPEYMAPEQARGDDADARSDLYAAGVMLYEMSVGEVPFKGRSALGAMTAHLNEAPPSPRLSRAGASISPALEAVILRALAKDPAERYPTARAFAEAIASARDEPTVITPARVDNPEGLGVDDTDLHIEPVSLGQAPTLRVDELAELRKKQLAASPVVVTPAGAADADRDEIARANTDSIPATKESPDLALLAGPSGDDIPMESVLPGTSRWVWVIVAVIAAAAGVVIGVFVGTR